MSIKKAIRPIVLLSIVGLLVCPVKPQGAASSTVKCAGLHAGITASFTQGYETPGVLVSFLLLNDSDSDLAASPESWKLIVDGKVLPDSGYLFGNGPQPSEGYATLRSGATFQFAKALPISKYFPEKREYKISWAGKNFQSPTVLIPIPAR